MIEEFIAGLLGSGIGVALLAFLAKGLIETRLKGAVEHEFGKMLEGLKHGQARALEDAKSKLKREELLFGKTLEAFAAFNAIQVNAEPYKLHPDMEWDEAMTEVANDLESTAKRLRAFLSEHSAFVPTPVNKLISRAYDFADDAKFGQGEEVQVGSMMIEQLRAARDAFGAEITAETTYGEQSAGSD